MITDHYGHPITGCSPQAVALFDEYVANFLAYGNRLRVIFAAADLEPEAPLINAHAAAVHMALEAASGYRHARPYLDRALKRAHLATRRERLFIEGVEQWWLGEPRKAALAFATVAERWPGDISAGKWSQYHFFNLGEHPPMLDVARSILTAHGETAYAHGMLAFALEQTHDIAGAEAAGRRALALNRQEPWAQHAIAHVLETEGRVREGIEFLEGHADTWRQTGVFIREHNFWHLALFYMDEERPARVLEIFDRHLWGEWPEFCQEQIGAIAGLWRLEMRGIDVGHRWGPVVAKVAERELEHVLPFHDLHYIYALARGGEEALVRAFLASMAHHAEIVSASVRPIWAHVALPLARGIAAYARGDFATAYRQMAPAMDQLQYVGGSHAQRDIFTRAYIEVLIGTDRNAEAFQHVAARHKFRPGVPETRRHLELVLDRMAPEIHDHGALLA